MERANGEEEEEELMEEEEGLDRKKLYLRSKKEKVRQRKRQGEHKGKGIRAK
jgi:hypothetical protein